MMVPFLKVSTEVGPGALDFKLAQKPAFRRDDNHVAFVEEGERPALSMDIEDDDVLLEMEFSGQGYLDIDEFPVGVPVRLGRGEGVGVALGGKHGYYLVLGLKTLFVIS